MADWDDFRKEITVSEGSIPYMYLDTVGKVTVGVGNMLPDVSAALELGFVNRTTIRLQQTLRLRPISTLLKHNPLHV